MELKIEIPQGDLTRQEQLLVWMRRAGLTYAAVAKSIGVGIMSVRRWLNADYISTWRHQQLVGLGIPATLLPPIKDVAPGPRRSKSIDILHTSISEQRHANQKEFYA